MRPIYFLLMISSLLHAAEGESVLARAQAAYEKGNYAEAERLHREALAVFEAKYPERQASIAVSLHNLGVLARKRGDDKEAEVLFDRVLEIRANLSDQGTDASADRAATLIEIANLWHSRHKPLEAERPVREAIAILEASPVGNEAALSAAYNTLGVLHVDLSDPEGGERQFRKALAISDSTPPSQRVTMRSNLAAALFYQGRIDEGLDLYRETMIDARRQIGAAHPRYQDLVRSYTQALRRAKRGGEAKAVLREYGVTAQAFTGK